MVLYTQFTQAASIFMTRLGFSGLRSKRVGILAVLVVVAVLYLMSSYLLPAHRHFHSTAVVNRERKFSCIHHELERWSTLMNVNDAVLKEIPPAARENRFFPFSGNGFVGLSVDGDSSRLYLLKNFGGPSYVEIPFAVVVSHSLEGDAGERSDAIILNIKTGTIHRLTGYRQKAGCVLVSQRIYVHRVHANVVMQEFQITNNDVSPITIRFSPLAPSKSSDLRRVQAADASYSLFTSVLQGSASDGYQELSFGMAVSDYPDRLKCNAFSVNDVQIVAVLRHEVLLREAPTLTPKRERKSAVEAQTHKNGVASKLESSLVDLIRIKSGTLWEQHSKKWMDISKVGVSIDSEDDPDSPYALHVNLTGYYLYSLTLLNDSVASAGEASCLRSFNGGPTFHTSALWVIPKTFSDLLTLQGMWMKLLTESKCLNPNLPASEQLYALREFLALSFLGLQYQKYYLQLALNPLFLASNVSVRNLPLDRFHSTDVLNVKVLVTPKLSGEKKMSVSCKGRHLPPLYACASACENIVELGNADLLFPIHTTDPVTPIFYVSTNRSALEAIPKSPYIMQVKKERLAVQEPHHLTLSPKFWVAVIILIAGFHVIVFKMIYNECRKDRSSRRGRGPFLS